MSKPKPAAKGATHTGQPRSSAITSKSPPKARAQAPHRVDQPTRDPGDWRAQTLSCIRALILEADPEMIEERKWRKPSNGMEGIPVWSHHGIVCTGETYKKVVKLTFARGAALPDPSHLFNASLEGGTRRAIDIHEGEQIDTAAFKKLVKAAVVQNVNTSTKRKTPMSEANPRVKSGSRATTARRSNSKSKSPAKAREKSKPVKLLSGGNPQIAKGDGDAPVQDYIAAMPGWDPSRPS